jgi:hypothetical protein
VAVVAGRGDPAYAWTAPAALNTNAASDSLYDHDVWPQVTTDGASNLVAVWESNENVGGDIGMDTDILYSRETPILSPVDGSLEVTSTDNCALGNWCFNKHRGPSHQNGICQSVDIDAWDVNLRTQTNSDADAGKWVASVGVGIVEQTYGGYCESVDTDGNSYGQVIIRHDSPVGNPWWSAYLHMTEIQVSPGQTVNAGTPLGRISNVSPYSIPNHLHFVVYNESNTKGGLVSTDATIMDRLGQSPLTTPASAEISILDVDDVSVYSLADTIRINPGGTNEEDNTVTGFGSLVLDSPLEFDHSIGEPVVVISSAIPVGGIADFPDVEESAPGMADSSDGSSFPYAALAGGLVALAALAAGGWYARRRVR